MKRKLAVRELTVRADHETKCAGEKARSNGTRHEETPKLDNVC